MVMSTNEDLLYYQPDIFDFGIEDYQTEHERAREDILRRLRAEWFQSARQLNGTSLYNKQLELLDMRQFVEMDVDRLDEAQFTRCAVYLCLADYILPQHTKWNAPGAEDKFQIMMKHYKSKYDEEFGAILRDGVRYDWDEDSTFEDHEIHPINYSGRMFR
jgi:hypothetical protein